MKVYPEINKYIDSKGYKKGQVMEIYNVPNKKIIYLRHTCEPRQSVPTDSVYQ
jgi:hypothetical protein